MLEVHEYLVLYDTNTQVARNDIVMRPFVPPSVYTVFAFVAYGTIEGSFSAAEAGRTKERLSIPVNNSDSNFLFLIISLR